MSSIFWIFVTVNILLVLHYSSSHSSSKSRGYRRRGGRSEYYDISSSKSKSKSSSSRAKGKGSKTSKSCKPGSILEDDDNCRCLQQCGNSNVKVEKCCDSGWLDVNDLTCKDPGSFSAKVQEKCFYKQKDKLGGATRSLKQIFMGRCHDYQELLHPDLFKHGSKDCESLFDAFFEAFAFQSPCGKVTAAQYSKFIKLTRMDKLPKDKLLFYSSIYKLSQDYSNMGSRLFTVESTLLGYLTDKLMFCGQPGKPGVNFDVCPGWSLFCDKNPMSSFWEAASIDFASQASGVTTIMLDGSSHRPPFRENSFFAKFELTELLRRCDQIELIRIWVVHKLDRPDLIQERCTTKGKTMEKLLGMLEQHGCNYSCQDNPREVKFLLCLNQPTARECIH